MGGDRRLGPAQRVGLAHHVHHWAAGVGLGPRSDFGLHHAHLYRHVRRGLLPRALDPARLAGRGLRQLGDLAAGFAGDVIDIVIIVHAMILGERKTRCQMKSTLRESNE